MGDEENPNCPINDSLTTPQWQSLKRVQCSLLTPEMGVGLAESIERLELSSPDNMSNLCSCESTSVFPRQEQSVDRKRGFVFFSAVESKIPCIDKYFVTTLFECYKLTIL